MPQKDTAIWSLKLSKTFKKIITNAITTTTMALTPCRARLMRPNPTQIISSLTRTYATDTTTPESFQAKPSSSDKTVPRWSQTPPAMKAGLQMNFAIDPRNKVWTVNNNPARLDEMYDRLLGPGGSKMLPEELKWLAVTHKSFDQGRRGFNDRLALMGKLALVMEATKDIVSKQPLAGAKVEDEFGREAFEHEQLLAVDNLNVESPKDVVGKEQLYDLAQQVGMLDVVRWKPRLVSLAGSREKSEH